MSLTLNKWRSQWRIFFFLTKEGKQNPIMHNSEDKRIKINTIQSTQTGTLKRGRGGLLKEIIL